MEPSSRRRRNRSRAEPHGAVEKREQAPTAASAFKVFRISDLPIARQEPKRKVQPAAIHFKIIEKDKSSSGYVELLAYCSDDNVGYALIDERRKGDLSIELILTFPAYRQQGVGPILLQEVERYGRSKGCRRLTGEVSLNDYTSSPADITRRARWFETQGFKVRRVAEYRWTLAKAL